MYLHCDNFECSQAGRLYQHTWRGNTKCERQASFRVVYEGRRLYSQRDDRLHEYLPEAVSETTIFSSRYKSPGFGIVRI
ncbi:hypothetical protein KC19_VG315300 [Ceratodon purpureus]|uniref:Uncharacterized protein n=1 Tax=Ceratodon purpureus TaxID=3225 RepID=A0A8T0HWH7_CERPU|nr:hypothetical protein KC19_VG315300 [Ceratodon purpureus]